MKIKSKNFCVKPGEAVKLEERPTGVQPLYESKKQYQTVLEEHAVELSALQRLHYASSRYALLLILEGMDAAGKDGAIRHVMSGVNPQDCQVLSFKQLRSWSMMQFRSVQQLRLRWEEETGVDPCAPGPVCLRGPRATVGHPARYASTPPWASYGVGIRQGAASCTSKPPIPSFRTCDFME